jgi:hypothetical protein
MYLRVGIRHVHQHQCHTKILSRCSCCVSPENSATAPVQNEAKSLASNPKRYSKICIGEKIALLCLHAVVQGMPLKDGYPLFWASACVNTTYYLAKRSAHGILSRERVYALMVLNHYLHAFTRCMAFHSEIRG